MPSREIIEIHAEEDVATRPGQSSPMKKGQDAEGPGSKPSVSVPQRKITPTTDDKIAEAPRKKAKQQISIAAFFGKASYPSTPSVSKGPDSNKKAARKSKQTTDTSSKKQKKQEPPTEASAKAPDKQPSTEPTPTHHVTAGSPSSASNASAKSSKSNHSKMDFKDVIVGKLPGRKSTSSSHKIAPKTDSSDSKKHAPAKNLDSMLPTIPPLSAVHSQAITSVTKHKAQSTNSPPSTQELATALSQDESDASTGYGAVRSQLVQKFENQTSDCAQKSVDTSDKARETKSDDDARGDTEEIAQPADANSNESVHPAPVNEESDDPASLPTNSEEVPDVEGVGVLPNSDDMDVDRKEDKVEHLPNTGTDKMGMDTKKEKEEHQTAQSDNMELPSDSSQAVAQDSKQPVDVDLTLSQPGKEAPMNTETQKLLSKHEAMLLKYCAQASELVKKGRQGLDDETVSVALPPTEGIQLGAPLEFPDEAVPHLVCLLEGSKLPLSELASNVCEKLDRAFADASLSLEIVSAKIKVLATRKPYVKNPAIASGVIGPNTISKDTVAFEDGNLDHMWRWEVTSLDLLPNDSIKEIKQARSARRKLQMRYNATANLLRALDEFIKLLRDTNTPSPKASIDEALGKVSREEEKVLKFEQDAEKARLLAEAKKQKQTSKSDKERQKEEKKRAAEERKREKEEEKQRKAIEREEAKKKKEEQARAEQAKKQKAQDKQKQRMMSFFKTSAKKQKTSSTTTSAAKATSVSRGKPLVPKDGFNAADFQARINSQSDLERIQPFDSLSRRAHVSRRRKAKRVKMRVFVSGQNPDDPFAPPAFAEERLIEVRNRNKFLSFREDCRPPYHGTWSKRSAVKSLGKKPFSKEPSLDYDVDSEAEWEEGDDDPGEDIENDAGDDEEEKALDEEGDTLVYNYQDGWLAQDDDIIGDDAEVDDDTKTLFKASRKRTEAALVPVCIVAPAFGGVPITEAYEGDNPMLQERVEGFPVAEAYKLVSFHSGAVLVDTDVFLDAFPPTLVEDRDGATDATSALPHSKEPSLEERRTIAKFVHHATLVSKSQVVEELRNSYPSVTASRAQAQRILDSMAEKQRHPNGGVYWEVKKEVIKSLGLENELKAMVLPDKPPEKKESKKRKTSDASESCQPKKKKSKSQSSTDSASKSKGATKKKTPCVSAASANLLKAFLVKKK